MVTAVAVAEGNALAVGLGEIKISRDPQTVLVAYGLGSCVAVAMYDPLNHVAGLLHAVLPERAKDADPHSAKYADSGIQSLLGDLERQGALRSRLVVRMVGGANMLALKDAKQALNIGERNVVSARATLAGLRLRIAAEDVGGNKGRTVRLSVSDGRMTVRVLGSETRDL
ncbi:MAG: chemotaxis protein CheD [Anaerolineales bacterium]|nr:chemotaxis protein CheD [Anaerolineales bacterium]